MESCTAALVAPCWALTVFGLIAIEKSGGGGGGGWIIGEPPPQPHAANGNRPSNKAGALRRSRRMKELREQRPPQETPQSTKETAAPKEAARTLENDI
jgi:hypothetical protein